MNGGRCCGYVSQEKCGMRNISPFPLSHAQCGPSRSAKSWCCLFWCVKPEQQVLGPELEEGKCEESERIVLSQTCPWLLGCGYSWRDCTLCLNKMRREFAIFRLWLHMKHPVRWFLFPFQRGTWGSQERRSSANAPTVQLPDWLSWAHVQCKTE